MKPIRNVDSQSPHGNAVYYDDISGEITYRKPGLNIINSNVSTLHTLYGDVYYIDDPLQTSFVLPENTEAGMYFYIINNIPGNKNITVSFKSGEGTIDGVSTNIITKPYLHLFICADYEEWFTSHP